MYSILPDMIGILVAVLPQMLMLTYLSRPDGKQVNVDSKPIKASESLSSTNADSGGKVQYRLVCDADLVNPFILLDTFETHDLDGLRHGCTILCSVLSYSTTSRWRSFSATRTACEYEMLPELPGEAASIRTAGK